MVTSSMLEKNMVTLFLLRQTGLEKCWHVCFHEITFIEFMFQNVLDNKFV